MDWLNQSIFYSIPDEKGSFADCSLSGSGIQCLNKHYNRDNFKHILMNYLDVLMSLKHTIEN